MRRGFLVACMLAAACLLLGQADYPGAKWVPAYSGNYTTSNRPSTYPIDYIVIHVMQGSYNGSISWFQNPNSNVSAHYLMRASDGDITQMVREKDVGWHAGNWNYNTWSVGIEHEGFVSDPSWFTPTVYQTSARLSRYLALKYNFPRTRQFIIGHNEVPGATHTDPGPHWDWNKYMALIRHSAAFEGAIMPLSLEPGGQARCSIAFRNDGDDPWTTLGANPVRLGTASPPDRSSPFYERRSWLSPSRPGIMMRPVQVGEERLFNFDLRAPSTPGVYTEAFQMVKEGVGSFGPIVEFTITVRGTDSIIDNSDSGFEAVGSWSTGTTAPGHYGPDYRFAGTPSTAYCSWFFGAPAAGYYDVYAWWSQGTNRSDAATYQVRTVKDVVDYVVNQQAGGGQWNLLGRHWISQGDGFVRLLATGPSGKVAIADAVRFIGPYEKP